MDARYFVTLNKYIREGDKVVVYTGGGKFRAVVEFVGQHFYSEEDLGWTKNKRKFLFPYRIKFKIIGVSKNPIKISFSTDELSNKAYHVNPNIIDEIVFIADKGRTWNQYLQVSIINITEESFKKLSGIIIES